MVAPHVQVFNLKVVEHPEEFLLGEAVVRNAFLNSLEGNVGSRFHNHMRLTVLRQDPLMVSVFWHSKPEFTSRLKLNPSS